VLSMLILAVLFWVLSRRKLSLPLTSRLVQDSDLATLAALTWCFGAAALAGMLDLSPPYGAFLAGLVLGNSVHSEALLKRAHPVKSVLLMVFFLSIGLLLDFRFIWNNLGAVLLLLLLVTVFKTALNVVALRLLRQSWPHAFLAGVALAQIGEFSFLLAETGKAARLISAQETKLVVAVTVLSLVLSPFWLFTMRRMHRVALVRVGSFRELMARLYGEDAQTVARLARRTRRIAGRVGGGGRHRQP
jgi:CPA2 family monovalent cation:H+ antiporter-2